MPPRVADRAGGDEEGDGRNTFFVVGLSIFVTMRSSWTRVSTSEPVNNRKHSAVATPTMTKKPGPGEAESGEDREQERGLHGALRRSSRQRAAGAGGQAAGSGQRGWRSAGNGSGGLAGAGHGPPGSPRGSRDRTPAPRPAARSSRLLGALIPSWCNVSSRPPRSCRPPARVHPEPEREHPHPYDRHRREPLRDRQPGQVCRPLRRDPQVPVRDHRAHPDQSTSTPRTPPSPRA